MPADPGSGTFGLGFRGFRVEGSGSRVQFRVQELCDNPVLVAAYLRSVGRFKA